MLLVCGLLMTGREVSSALPFYTVSYYQSQSNEGLEQRVGMACVWYAPPSSTACSVLSRSRSDGGGGVADDGLKQRVPMGVITSPSEQKVAYKEVAPRVSLATQEGVRL